MSELRFDPIKRHWVIIAGQRAKRPSEFQITIRTQDESECPFCPGHEDETPESILTLPGKEGNPWAARLIPNKFPAMDADSHVMEGELAFHEVRAGRGQHEVMIESASHGGRQSHYSISHFTSILSIYQSRLRLFTSNSCCRYAALFTNVGYRGGATLSHPHSQIIGLPMIPSVIQSEMDSATAHLSLHGRCLFCDLIESEIGARSRLVFMDDDFAVFAPYASRFAYEFAVYPRSHLADFCELELSALEATAKRLIGMLGLMDSALENPDYNLILHTAPRAEPGIYSETIKKAFHWHFEVIPRVSTQAGMEWGTGIHINSIPPEKAACVLTGMEPYPNRKR